MYQPETQRKCESAEEHFTKYIVGLFTNYNEHLPKMHEKNLKTWLASKDKLEECDGFDALTKKLQDLKVKTLDIGELAPRPPLPRRIWRELD